MLRTTKIVPVDGINSGEFITQVVGYKVITVETLKISVVLHVCQRGYSI